MTAEAPSAIAHSRKGQAISWAVAIALIALGAYLSRIEFMGEEWLSRSGCLVVILGIWSGLGGIIQERVLVSRLRLRRRMAVLRTKRRMRGRQVSQERIDEELEDIAKRFEENTRALSDRLRLSLGLLEVSLLMTGTFLWGFGDLLVRL